MIIRYKCKSANEQYMIMKHIVKNMDISVYHYVEQFNTQNRFNRINHHNKETHYNTFPYMYWNIDGRVLAASKGNGSNGHIVNTRNKFLREIGCITIGPLSTIPPDKTIKHIWPPQ